MLKSLGLYLVFFALIGCGSFENRVAVEDDDGAPMDTEISESDMTTSNDYGEIKLVVNKPVLKWIQYYQGRGRRHMRRYIERSSKYFPMMREELRKEGLPEDLVYVPIIESGLSPSAHSIASAVGYWQFIRGTGKRYGLRIDRYIDERRDPVLSTRAAARYFKALYNLFGDWYLALASYNTGENRVKRAVMKYNTRNFWKLAKRRIILRETRNYVPKFLAAMIIVKNPEEYGFTNLSYYPRLKYDYVSVNKPISLDKLAKNMGLKYEDLKELNPMFRSDYVPVDNGKAMNIRVPSGMAQVAVNNISASVSSAPKIIPQDYYWYRVRRGDTLSHIAQRNRTTVRTIRRLNNLGRRSFIRVGQRLRVPERGVSQLRAQKRRAKSYNKSAKKAAVNPGSDYHVVKKGESLSVIAENYGVGLSVLRQHNRLGRRSFIRAGQKLYIPKTANKVSASSQTKTSTEGGLYHTVRQGESLSVIAERYGIGLSELRKLNRLGRRSMIRAGQKLIIKEGRPVPSSQRQSQKTSVHVVKRGENLSLIAQKYDLSLSKLKAWNGLDRRAMIRPGQKLAVSPQERVHVVKSGENLSLIASRYKVSVAEIAQANSLKSRSKIFVGKRLVIP